MGITSASDPLSTMPVEVPPFIGAEGLGDGQGIAAWFC